MYEPPIRCMSIVGKILESSIIGYLRMPMVRGLIHIFQERFINISTCFSFDRSIQHTTFRLRLIPKWWLAINNSIWNNIFTMMSVSAFTIFPYYYLTFSTIGCFITCFIFLSILLAAASWTSSRCRGISSFWNPTIFIHITTSQYIISIIITIMFLDLKN